MLLVVEPWLFAGLFIDGEVFRHRKSAPPKPNLRRHACRRANTTQRVSAKFHSQANFGCQQSPSDLYVLPFSNLLCYPTTIKSTLSLMFILQQHKCIHSTNSIIMHTVNSSNFCQSEIVTLESGCTTPGNRVERNYFRYSLSSRGSPDRRPTRKSGRMFVRNTVKSL
ncbi:hypothetical protein DIPPA_59572 [Diplonema papillatum]|nr:hypothetical protein DIPPA_59572 [Diplonema papillatum]